MRLEIFSDLVCPWCFIGKRQLDSVLNTPQGQDLDVVWRAYQLYPNIPQGGMVRDEFMKVRFAGSDTSIARERILGEAKAAGIDMDFSRAERMPNTFNGHRLLHHALMQERQNAELAGLQHRLAEKLFSFYFCEGRDVGSQDVLLAAAEQVGLDGSATRAFLESDAGRVEVEHELDRAAAVGVSGVPCFLFAGAFALQGAQSPEVIGHFLSRARQRLAPDATGNG